jgi:hypothetical protein
MAEVNEASHEMRKTTVKREDLPEQVGLHEALATAIDIAYREREVATSRPLSIIITHLEEAAMWLAFEPSIYHGGENALPDALRQI